METSEIPKYLLNRLTKGRRTLFPMKSWMQKLCQIFQLFSSGVEAWVVADVGEAMDAEEVEEVALNEMLKEKIGSVRLAQM